MAHCSTFGLTGPIRLLDDLAVPTSSLPSAPPCPSPLPPPPCLHNPPPRPSSPPPRPLLAPLPSPRALTIVLSTQSLLARPLLARSPSPSISPRRRRPLSLPYSPSLPPLPRDRAPPAVSGKRPTDGLARRRRRCPTGCPREGPCGIWASCGGAMWCMRGPFSRGLWQVGSLSVFRRPSMRSTHVKRVDMSFFPPFHFPFLA